MTAATRPLHPIGVAQKRVILCILAEMLLIAGLVAAALVLPPQVYATAVPPVFFSFYIALKIAQVAFTWMLFSALGKPGALGILSVLGIMGLAVLAWGSQEATKALRAGGVRVGFLGVSGADLERLASSFSNAGAAPP